MGRSSHPPRIHEELTSEDGNIKATEKKEKNAKIMVKSGL